jgi:hypothetical protein
MWRAVLSLNPPSSERRFDVRGFFLTDAILPLCCLSGDDHEHAFGCVASLPVIRLALASRQRDMAGLWSKSGAVGGMT